MVLLQAIAAALYPKHLPLPVPVRYKMGHVYQREAHVSTPRQGRCSYHLAEHTLQDHVAALPFNPASHGSAPLTPSLPLHVQLILPSLRESSRAHAGARTSAVCRWIQRYQSHTCRHLAIPALYHPAIVTAAAQSAYPVAAHPHYPLVPLPSWIPTARWG